MKKNKKPELAHYDLNSTPEGKRIISQYREWLKRIRPKSLLGFEDITTQEIKASFEKKIKYMYSGITSKIGHGTAFFNDYTLNHLAKAIKTFMEEKKVKTLLFATSDEENIPFLKSLIEIFNAYGIKIAILGDFIKTQSEVSFSLNDLDNMFGLYLYSYDSVFTIKILDNKGKEFERKSLDNLNSILEKQEFDFSYSKISYQKIDKLIINDFIQEKKYFNHSKPKNLPSFKDNKIVLVANSEATKILAEKLSEKFNIKMEVILNKKVSSDPGSPSFFFSGYKKARKYKENVFFAIDKTGEKINIAIKQKKVFKFLSSIELNAILVEIFKKERSFLFDTRLPSFLDIKNNIKNNNLKNLNLSIDFKNSINNYEYFDAFPILIEFSSRYLNDNKFFQRNLVKSYEEIGHISYEVTNKKISEENFDILIKNIKKYKRMENIKINFIDFHNEDNLQKTFLAKTNEGEIFLIFKKETNILNIHYYSCDNILISSVNKKDKNKEMFEIYSKIEVEEQNFFNKKRLISMFLSFSLIATVLLLMFTYVFDWNEILSSFDILSKTWGKPYIYALILNLLLTSLTLTIVNYYAIRLVRKNVLFRDIYLCNLISAFTFTITPLPIFAIGFSFWFYSRKGYRASDTLTLNTIALVSSLVMSLTYNNFMNIYSYFYLNSLGMNINYIFAMGWISIAMFWLGTGTLVIAAYSKRFQYFVLYFIERIFFLIGRTNNYQKLYSKFTFGAENNKNNINSIVKNKSFLFFAIFLAFLTYLWSDFLFYCSVNSVSYSMGINEINNFVGLASLKTITYSASGILPNNGAVGLSEILLKNVITELTGSTEVASQATFIQRFFTYYGVMLITFPVFAWFVISLNRNKKYQEVKWKK